MGVFYCTRESVKLALDASVSGNADTQVDEAIDAASREVEERTNRVFYPWRGTRYLNWPDAQNGTSYRLWLDENELIELYTVSSGGSMLQPGTYNLEPSSSGPPFDSLELIRSGPSSFGLGNDQQRNVALTGVFGFRDDTRPVGQLVSGLVGTNLFTSAPASIGIGSVLQVADERLLVTDRAWANSTYETTAAIDGSLAAQAVPVGMGPAFQTGEVILVDAEEMLVRSTAGNNLIVVRAVNGSVLADHASGADVYRSSALTVARGALGTEAAGHDAGTAVLEWQAPAPIRSLVRAQAIDTVLQEQAGYARTVGGGDTARNASGAGLAALWDRVTEQFTRYRMGVV